MVSRSAPQGSHVRHSRGISARGYITSNDAHSAAGLYSENTAVDVDLRTCDVGRLIGSQEQDGVCHLVYFPRPAHWNEAHSFSPDSRIGGATGCAHRRHDAGMNRVGADIVLAVLHRDP